MVSAYLIEVSLGDHVRLLLSRDEILQRYQAARGGDWNKCRLMVDDSPCRESIELRSRIMETVDNQK